MNERLDYHMNMVRLRYRHPGEACQLAHDIIDKASGVFLWVRVVVDLVIIGLGDGDSLSELQDLLRTLPEELGGRNGLYMRMLKDIKPNHLQQASHLFRIMQQAWNGVSLLDMSFAQQDPSATLHTPISPWTKQMADDQSQIMEDRLKSRCQGLLEIQHLSYPSKHSAYVKAPELRSFDNSRMVRYLHLSVEEFLENSFVWGTVLPELSEPKFDGNFSLLNACVFKLKHVSPRPLSFADPYPLVYIWEVILEAMHHAAAAEKVVGNVPQLERLIDELDKGATVLLDGSDRSDEIEKGTFAKCATFQYHWTMTEPQEQSGKDMNANDTFVSFVVQAGLKSYMEAKLEQSGKSILEKYGRPVLDYAVAPHPSFTTLRCGSRQWDGIGASQAHPHLVELLLWYGANPNEQYPRGRSRYSIHRF